MILCKEIVILNQVTRSLLHLLQQSCEIKLIGIMNFRPCIDLHQGKVKQIVGSTLSDEGEAEINFEATQSPRYYAELYRQDSLSGGHVIQLGAGNVEAAKEALAGYPGGLQLGGGVTEQNAQDWLDAGASAVIVTSFVFHDGVIDWQRLKALSQQIGKERLVLDLSCRQRGGKYFVVTDRWQTFTDVEVTPATMKKIADYCAEFLVHAVDVEGKQAGIDEVLIPILAQCDYLPMTYAGGIRNLDDLCRVDELGQGRIDATIGSALDLFGGELAYQAVVEYCKRS